MPETVSGINGGAYLATFDFARNLIVSCDSFRLDILDGATPDEAKDKVYYQETLAERDDEGEAEDGEPLPELEPRPYALVIDGQRTRSLVGIGEWSGTGQLIFVFEVLVPNEYIVDHQTDNSAVKREKFRGRKRWAMALVGRLEDELTENSGGADEDGSEYLNVVDIDLLAPPADPDEAESQDYVGFAFQVTWK